MNTDALHPHTTIRKRIKQATPIVLRRQKNWRQSVVGGLANQDPWHVWSRRNQPTQMNVQKMNILSQLEEILMSLDV